jgi:hypothetical protein
MALTADGVLGPAHSDKEALRLIAWWLKAHNLVAPHPRTCERHIAKLRILWKSARDRADRAKRAA